MIDPTHIPSYQKNSTPPRSPAPPQEEEEEEESEEKEEEAVEPPPQQPPQTERTGRNHHHHQQEWFFFYHGEPNNDDHTNHNHNNNNETRKLSTFRRRILMVGSYQWLFGLPLVFLMVAVRTMTMPAEHDAGAGTLQYLRGSRNNSNHHHSSHFPPPQPYSMTAFSSSFSHHRRNSSMRQRQEGEAANYSAKSDDDADNDNEDNDETRSQSQVSCATTATSPVIGVLALPTHSGKSANGGSDNSTYFYIAASYIKWLESAGARTVVIPYYDGNETTPEQAAVLDELFLQIHMVFLTGGAASYPKATLNYLLDKVVQRNQEHFFPVWGTCLGMEFLLEYVARRGGAGPGHDEEILEPGFDSHNVSLALEQVVVQDLYADPLLHHIGTHFNVTFNNHEMGISPKRFRHNAHLSQTFVMTSINHDALGRPFVSTIEPNKEASATSSPIHSWLPFYGVQFHPEKNAFEYGIYPDMAAVVPLEHIDHSSVGITFSFHMAQFVVNLARQSMVANFPTHCYTKVQLFPPVYTYPVEVGTEFEQRYMIPQNFTNNFFATATIPSWMMANDQGLIPQGSTDSDGHDE